MPQATFSVRMDEKLKKEFEELCDEFGMNMSTAINVFARAVVRQQRIPFEISSVQREIAKNEAMYSFEDIRKQSLGKYPNGLTMAEIDEEIYKAHREKNSD